MKSAYLVTGIRFRALMKLMIRNHYSVLPPYCFRFLFILQNSLWSSFFARRDHLIWGEYYGQYPLPDNPIIIVGHWRTGSTWLHQLMNLDPELSAPTLYQTSMPCSFITARPFYEPVMKRLIGKFRPFDQVRAGIDEPQEDEFALFRMGCVSPLEQVMFPGGKDYFLLSKESVFLPEGDAEEKLVRSMKAFYTKVAWFNRKRLVLKNPFHSMRISMLRQVFPNARFIHIIRDPYEVVPSTIRMWSVVGRQNSMNHRWKDPQVAEVAEFYAKMLRTINKDFCHLPAGTYTQLTYESLVADPVAALQQAYQEIGLQFSPEFVRSIQTYMEENKGFEKNRYQLSDQDNAEIANRLDDLLPQYKK